MAELDTIFVCNPTDEDFAVGYNGEQYALKANEKGARPHHLARHMAKHLSDRMLAVEFRPEEKKMQKAKMAEPAIGIRKSQRVMLDNPHRRIALYKILQSKEEVEKVIRSYPQFKATPTGFNFVGEMSEYDDFVEKYNQPEESPKEPEAPKKEEKTSKK